MSARHHPDTDVLLAHAAGELDLAGRVLLESHLELCPACADEVAALRAPGGSWLREGPGETVPEGLWDAVRGRIDATSAPRRSEWDDTPLPGAARAELGAPVPLAWRSVPWSQASYVPLWKGLDAALLLVRLGPDLRLPEHLHVGGERLVVLAGGYEDHRGTSATGDYRDYGPGSKHAPLTEPDESCWIVTRIEGEVRFTGWRGVIGRLLRRRHRRNG